MSLTLREALDKYDEGNNTIWYNPPWVHKLAEAARLVADPDTLVINWCEEHDAQGWKIDSLSCWRMAAGLVDCRMVKRILLPALDVLLEGPK